jgi:anaerobic ribonucleoside-triphosphate reductase activating protein
MVKNLYPQTKIIIWTGYQYEDLKNNPKLNYIFQNIDYLIEGPFILEERDITLKWRGSRNQRIIDMKQTLLDKEVKLYTE